MHEAGTLPATLEALGKEARGDAWSKSTWNTYKSSSTSWARFCDIIGVDAYCEEDDGSVFCAEKIEDIISDYITMQCGIRKVAPQSVIKTYLPGVAAGFDMMRKKCSKRFRVAISSKEIKLAAQGFQRKYDKLNPKATRMKLPYCMDLVVKSKKAMRKRNAFHRFGERVAAMLRKRVYVAQTVGSQFMLRKSEHIGSPVATATKMTRRKVVFFDIDNKPIPYAKVKKVKAMSVWLNVDFAKTDASGFGRRSSHMRQEGHEDVCVVCVLEDWIADTRDNFGAREDDGLYEVPSYGTLSVETLQQVMQWTVDDLYPEGEKPKRVTSHSLRYGGATMMAAAGFPHYIIAIYGGWSVDSKSLKGYTKPSAQMTKLVSAHMVAMAKTETSTYFINDAFVVAMGNQREEKG
jgi:hypothetical protein